MINEIKIRNFKSHKNTEIELSNLTVFCGSNGVGKSSAIQSLLLLRDTFIKDKSFDNLDLKSKSVKIGTVNDAIYEFSKIDGFDFRISINNTQYDFYFETKTEDEKTKDFIKLANSTIPNSVNNKNLFSSDFQYISAYRLGPQLQYFKDDKIVDIYRQISENDGKAEYFVHFLDKYRNESVINDIQKNNIYDDLFSQVIAWEKEISEGVNIDIQDLGKLGYTLRYSFDTEKSTSRRTRNFEATNVGFGLSYVMPIIVAILSAKPGALIIIENPEAHLHPNGIAKLTELICLAAQAGIQIIIETHSDHIINGILVQSKKFEESGKGISKDNVSIYHFDRDEIEHSTKTTKIPIQEDGRIRYPPKGFFDQFTIDRKFLMGF